MKTIYISLPINGYDLQERREVARRQREKLMAEGWAVVDPLNQQANIPDEASWQEHMRYDLKLLLSCDAIYMMDGWHTSRGCTTEYLVASYCGLEILGTICTDVYPYVVITQSLRELPDDRTVEEDNTNPILSRGIFECGLSVRAMHCLECADIHTVGDLVQWKRSDLLKLRNFGLHTIREIEDFLTDHDLTFGMKVKEAQP